MKSFLFTLTLLLCASLVKPQNNQGFCRAVEKGNFLKVERVFRNQVHHRRHGKVYDNGSGSGNQITHQYNLDTLTLWLKNMECVEDATWDKCQIKILIYPGWSTIGAKFKTRAGVVEKCFVIQEGTTGSIRLFGWRPHLFKAKNKMVYKKIIDCEGFIQLQRKNCNS